VADFFDERANQKNHPRRRLLEKMGQFTDSNFDFKPIIVVMIWSTK
jgi:hypothetical protein